MSFEYFSDRENGPRPRMNEEIPPTVWNGIVMIVDRALDDESFGLSFPQQCEDNKGICGTDTKKFYNTLYAEIPDLIDRLDPETVPPFLSILDLIEFCHTYIANPIKGEYHDYWYHYEVFPKLLSPTVL